MICHKFFVLVFISIILRCTSQKDYFLDDLFPLTIVHINDFHASYPTSCETFMGHRTCYKGYARIVHTVKRLLKDNQNVVFLNAGDNFGGNDIWYTLGRWRLISEFANMMPADAMTLGPNEFDHGIEGLAPCLDALKNTTMLVANMDSATEPTMQGKYQKSMIIERGNRKIGVIGVTTVEQNKIGIGNLIFQNEGTSIEEEVAKLKSQGAKIIILISHCGFEADKVLAKRYGCDIDVIVGAYHPDNLRVVPRPDYPTVENRVLIVQADTYGQSVGELMVKFDNYGHVVDYKGALIEMSNSVPEDSEVATAWNSKQRQLENERRVQLGISSQDVVYFHCYDKECTLGNFLCDAMVDAVLDFHSSKNDSLTQVPIAIINYNSFHELNLYKGRITYSTIARIFKYKNTLIAFDLTGNHLLEALEYGASVRTGIVYYNFFQVAGLKVTYDLKKPMFQRVTDIQVRCGNCASPSYVPFSENSMYRIVAPESLINGIDNFHTISNYASNKQSYMELLDAVKRYIVKTSPINPRKEGRIVVL